MTRPTTLIATVGGILAIGLLLLPGGEIASAVLLLALTGIAIGLVSVADGLRDQVESRYRRTEAWLAIYSVIRPRIPLGPIHVYMATPELLRHFVHLLLETRPALTVELGSGLSTVLAAYCAEQLDRGRIISVDHEARFCEATRQQLVRHGLEHRVRLVHAPLVPTGLPGHTSAWYDVGPIQQAIQEEHLSLDLLLVDGPPGKGAPLARYPALPLLRQLLAPRAVILVDDARRPDEQEMVRRWVDGDHTLEREDLATEKGTIILRRSGGVTPDR